jgi:ABC-type transport system substrate-binding protein
MWEANDDFKLRQNNPDYQTDYLPKYYFGQGDFKGITVGASTTYPDIDGYLFNYYYSKGGRQKTAYKGQNGDARSDSLIEAQRKELDANKRVEIVKEWQRYMATKFLMIPYPGQSPAYSLAWPWVMNRGAFRDYQAAENAAQESLIHWWFDKTKYTG